VFNPFNSEQNQSHFDILQRRVGDIQQVQGHFNGIAEYKNRDPLVQLSGPLSVIGRAMVIYEREDDFEETEHPATRERDAIREEGMGRAIGCCVIGLAKFEKEVRPSVELEEEPEPEPVRGYFGPQAFGPHAGFNGPLNGSFGPGAPYNGAIGGFGGFGKW